MNPEFDTFLTRYIGVDIVRNDSVYTLKEVTYDDGDYFFFAVNADKEVTIVDYVELIENEIAGLYANQNEPQPWVVLRLYASEDGDWMPWEVVQDGTEIQFAIGTAKRDLFKVDYSLLESLEVGKAYSMATISDAMSSLNVILGNKEGAES